MSLYTHWVCFGCRKSVHRPPLDEDAETARKCTECSSAMYDFGVYFEPPRRQAKKAWAILQLLAECEYKFQTEGSVVYIKKRILKETRNSLESVRQRLDLEQSERETSQIETRLQSHQQEKRRRR